MSEINEQLERLINRSLDGDLSEDAQLELDRELIRNPAARALLDEYQGIDRGAAAALGQAFDAARLQPIVRVGSGALTPQRHGRRRHAVRWLIPGAIAAALLATVIPYPSFEVPKPSTDRLVTAPPKPISPGLNQGLVPVRTVSTGNGAPAVHRDRGRDIIGVLGDDGNLYWIEVEKTRTVTLPHGNAARAANVF